MIEETKKALFLAFIISLLYASLFLARMRTYFAVSYSALLLVVVITGVCKVGKNCWSEEEKENIAGLVTDITPLLFSAGAFLVVLAGMALINEQLSIAESSALAFVGVFFIAFILSLKHALQPAVNFLRHFM